jgi:hypothetical protein
MISSILDEIWPSYFTKLKNYQGPFASKVVLGAIWLHIARKNRVGDPTELFPSIIQIIAGEKRFPPPNFNLKIMRIQCGYGSWMLLDALLHC